VDILPELCLQLPEFSGFDEANTKNFLIAPILRALGWRLDSPADVNLEYRKERGDNPVDYALSVGGFPQALPALLIEAKRLSEDIGKRSFLTQTVSYAATSGVRWAVLTNGRDWAVYDSHKTGDVRDRLFLAFSITDSDAVRHFQGLSRAAFEARVLEGLAQSRSDHDLVSSALSGLFMAPRSKLLTLLRDECELPPDRIRKVLAGFASNLQPLGAVDPASAPAPVLSAPAPSVCPRRHQNSTDLLGQISQVLGHGLSPAPKAPFYRTDDDSKRVVLLTSKFYSDRSFAFWFTTRGGQEAFFLRAKEAYFAFGCSSRWVVLMPFQFFQRHQGQLPQSEGREGSHIKFSARDGRFELALLGRGQRVDVTDFLLFRGAPYFSISPRPKFDFS